MYHYVYRLDHLETGEFYIGSRTSKVHPSLDPYLGSMKTWKPDKTKLKKTILKDDFLTRELAILFEADEISKVIDEDLNRNYNIPFKGYHTIGLVTVRDKDGKTSSISKNDPRYLSGELVHIMNGMVIVKDKESNIFAVSVNDHRYLSGELIIYTKGHITVKDKYDNTFRIDINDPRFLSGELVGITKHMLTVKDKEGNTSSISLDDPRYLSGELVPTWLGKKHSEKTIEKYKKTFKRIGHQQGEKNSNWGKCWIYKGDENKKIKKEELNNYIELGWLKGRICNELKNRKCINKDSLIKYINENEIDAYLTLGWSLGKN